MCADRHTDIHDPHRTPQETSGGSTSYVSCQQLLDVAHRMVDYVPGTDILTLRSYLFDALPPEYKEQIDQICCRQQPPAVNNISINAPGNMVAPGAHTVTLNNRLLPPQTAADG